MSGHKKASNKTEKGGGHTDIHTDGLRDQPTRLLEFHMLYGTKKIHIT